MNRVLFEWGIVVLLAVFAALRRKKIRVISPLMVTLGVTFFALLTPSGKVLLYVYSFPITAGALALGLHKSAVLTGMVFLSQIIISRNIRLPGKAGAFFTQIFADFDALTEKRISLKKGHIIQALDARLMEVCDERGEKSLEEDDHGE